MESHCLLFSGEEVGAPVIRNLSEFGRDFDYRGHIGVDGVGMLLDLGEEKLLEKFLTGTYAARLGGVLFELLFPPGGPWQSALNRIASTTAGVNTPPTRFPVRLRVLTSDPVFAGLPWRLTAFEGKWLVDHGWTFEVTAESRPGPDLQMLLPCKILVIAPEHNDMHEMRTAEHIADIRSILLRADPTWGHYDVLRVVRSRAEFLQALPEMKPDLLYYWGSSGVEQGQLCLHLGAPGEKRESLSFDEMKRLFASHKHFPQIAYLNSCMTAATGWHAAGHQLCPEVPVVLAQRTTAFVNHAARSALRWLVALVEERQDPVIAAHRLDDEDTRRDFQWCTLIVHAAYGDSIIEAARRTTHGYMRLDRSMPKAIADQHITLLLNSRDRRVESLVAYGAPGNLVSRFSWQARDYLQRIQRHRVHRVRVSLPTEPTCFHERLDCALRTGLGIATDQSLGDALRRCMPPQTTLLWLDWGTTEYVPSSEMSPVPLRSWLEYCCDVLARHCPDSLRIVCYLGLELPDQEHAALRIAIDDFHVRRTDHYVRFGCAALPLSPRITLGDLINFFSEQSNHTCPTGRIRTAAELIYERSDGVYEKAVELIRLGEEKRWIYAYFNELMEKPATVPPLPNPFRPGPALTGVAELPGRAAAVAEILALLHNGCPALLRGPRRSGKSSLLHLIAAHLAPLRYVRHVTLEGKGVRNSDDLACLLEPSLREHEAPATALALLLSAKPHPVLLLDEVSYLTAADPALFPWLRALGQEGTALMLAGSHQDWVRVIEQAAKLPGSSFGNDVTPVDLGSIQREDAVRFLVETAPPDVPIAAERTAAWIINRCGPWPFYLQVMGHSVVQAVRAGRRLALAEQRGVDDIYETRLLQDRDAVFRDRWGELPPRARNALLVRRQGPLPEISSLGRAERRELRESGLYIPGQGWLEDRPLWDWLRLNADDLGE